MNSLAQRRLEIDPTVRGDHASVSSPGRNKIKVAHSIEEMMQAFAVRAAVFMNAGDCPYAEEFDGNDFTATQILGLCGEEPVATMRIRYFADFARLERMAVRREFRGRDMAARIVEFAFDLCRQKGYRKLHGNAEEHLLPFWQKFGWRRLNTTSYAYAGHRYVEIECDLERHSDPIEMGTDPVRLMRPEGAWDEPGPAELANRPTAVDLSGDGRDGGEWATDLRRHMECLG